MPNDTTRNGGVYGTDAGRGATDALFPLVYDELKRVARSQLRTRAADATLSTTELVHEVFLKLARGGGPWEDAAHFYGAAARAMRQVLVDFARRRRAAKRGGARPHVTLGESASRLQLELDEIIDLDQALVRLDAFAPRLRQVVELRFFAGLAPAEIARLLGITTRTVERDWLKARLILLHELQVGPLLPEPD